MELFILFELRYFLIVVFVVVVLVVVVVVLNAQMSAKTGFVQLISYHFAHIIGTHGQATGQASQRLFVPCECRV